MSGETTIANDTIAAIATGAGKAGIGVVRVSGPLASQIAETITGQPLQARNACYLPFLNSDSEALDVGIAILFNAPHSYTGEDVLELQGHGGAVILDMVLARVLECGARMARPGEFTERAFLNDKLDLAQAEAVCDLIESSSKAAAKAAVRSMSGEFSKSISEVQSELTALRAWLEAALDFSEEEIDFLADQQLSLRAESIVQQFDVLMQRAQQGQRLRDGFTVVIAGVTNVGKSSLLNALSGEDSAIVTDIEGTTRDVLHEHITLDGVPLHIIDTAGLRDTQDVVEQEGINRAHLAIESADHVLVITDAERMALPQTDLPDNLDVTLVLNKIDLMEQGQADTTELANKTELSDAAIAQLRHALPSAQSFGVTADTGSIIPISVKTGQGLDQLKQHLLSLVGHDAQLDGAFIARRRHLDALDNARSACMAALARLQEAEMPELAAEELRQAQLALDAVTGRFDSEDLLGEIFGSFCIGK